MEFAEAFAQIEAAAMQKAQEGMEGSTEEVQAKVHDLFMNVFDHVWNACNRPDLPGLVCLLGKITACGAQSFLPPGHTPTEIQEALEQTAPVFSAAFVPVALGMYGVREDLMKQQKAQQPAAAPTEPKGRVIDMSRLRGKI